MIVKLKNDGSTIWRDNLNNDLSFIDETEIPYTALTSYLTESRGSYQCDISILFAEIDVNIVILENISLAGVYDYKTINNVYFKDEISIKQYFSIVDVPCPECPEVTLPNSLNGNFYSFKDNEIVICYPDTREYTVIRSYLVAYDKNALTIMYELIDSDLKTHVAPHEFLVKK